MPSDPNNNQNPGHGDGQPSGQQNGQGQTNDTQNNQQGTGQQSGTPLTYDAWLAQQPEEVKTLIEGNITGLRNTVQATRQERDDLQGRLAEITKALGKDPVEAKRLLDEMSGELDTANKRAAFAEEAIKPEIGCTNPRAAFLVAQSEQLFDRRGNPDWAAIKQAAPELFRGTQRPPAGNAGTGTGSPPPAGKSMNDFIRRAAGR